MICPCDTGPPPVHFSNDNLVARSPGTGVIFIRRLYWEIHLIFVSITHSSPLSLLLSLLFCHAFLFILPVFTVAVSNPATLREAASISHSGHTPIPVCFQPHLGLELLAKDNKTSRLLPSVLCILYCNNRRSALTKKKKTLDKNEVLALEPKWLGFFFFSVK